MKKRILVTGGTVFVSKFTASYFQAKGYDVTVLNRGSKNQVPGVTLLCADRNHLMDCLKDSYFDAILDICAYTQKDIQHLLDAVGGFEDYIFISSSAVYPEGNPQPFLEEQTIGANSVWGAYGINKVEAESYLRSKVPDAYILRPPYLYGPMQNVYREPFVFECALKHRKFYIPKDGTMKLQFFHVEDLCKIMEILLEKHPKEHILNVGNREIIDINTFVSLCYQIADTPLEKVYISDHTNQRDYFSFYDYEYTLDVTKQNALIPEQKSLIEGLTESFEWYQRHSGDVARKNYISFIDQKTSSGLWK